MENDDERGYVQIERSVFLEVEAIILRKMTIGDNSILGSGAIVPHDVPPHVIVAGNLAKVIKIFTLLKS